MNLITIEQTFRNPQNGQYLKGREPHNKGKKWSEYLPKKTQKSILKNLKPNPNYNLAGANARKIVGIKDGKWRVFESSKDAERKLGIHARNIRTVCYKKRNHAGGWKWFFENDNEWINLIK